MIAETPAARTEEYPLDAVVDEVAAALEPPRVVILGGGVAGLTAAYELQRRLGTKARISVISSSDHFVLGPALLDVPFGRRAGRIRFALAPALQKHHIDFVHARVERVEPERHVVVAQYKEIPYDYLLIATGPRADGVAIPGVAGQFNATESLWNEGTAVEAGHALQRFLETDNPGPVVVGIAPGAGYLSAAYEFVLTLDDALRRRGTRERTTITFVTPEPYLGHLDVGAPAARRVLERLFARRGITALTGVAIERVDRAGVHVQGGPTLPAAYSLVLPPFSGAVGIWKSPGLSDARGFVPVTKAYRHVYYDRIYAAGVAAQVAVTSPLAEGLPQTGYLASTMAKAAAQNLAAVISGHAPVERPLPRLLDLRLLEGGNVGILLLTAQLMRPLHLALPLPGWAARAAKGVLIRYLLWKLRTGRTMLP